ncbi:fumarylacetoacetate hydrolase family protein [Streptomyces sp. NPDC097640]|uniref:fumarylacetoacetate hydrolase family protein n=1 Tax=Streptomyces sp. NPDC097640 TaxID=3157229 RepID=UPI00332010AE
MRIGTFGDGRLAVVLADGSVDVTELLDGQPLYQVIGQGEPPALRIGPADLADRPRLCTAELDWQPPLPHPGKIIGAPANYYDHIDEMPDSATIVDWGLFLKAPTSVIGHGGTVRLPWSDKRTDHEGELAVVIGRSARKVSPRDALRHVFGYTCLLDVTVRSTEDRSLRKSFDTFTPVGPWITTADEIPDPGRLELSCHVNGELRQHTSTSKMIYSVPHLIAYASAAMTLHPGDIIATGTPAGVGPLTHGDRVTVTIDRIGTLEVLVSGEDAIPYQDRPGHKAER